MSVQLFARSRRENFPVRPAAATRVEIPPPPEIQRPIPKNALRIVGPLIMIVCLVAVMGVLYKVGMMRLSIFPIMMVITYFMMFRRQGGQQKQTWGEGEGARQDWYNDSDVRRLSLIDAASRQFKRAWWCHPDPADLIKYIRTPRMWERRADISPDPSQNDFGDIRLGVGVVRQKVEVAVPALPDDPVWTEPASLAGHRKMVRTQKYVRDMPRVVSLPNMKAIALVGALEDVRGTARAVIAQLCTWHSHVDAKVMVITSDPDRWAPVMWLPHAQDPDQRDGCGERRMVFSSPKEFEAYHAKEINDRGSWARPPASSPKQQESRTPFWLVIDDACGTPRDWEGAAPPKGVKGVCFLRLSETVKDGLGFRPDTTYRIEHEADQDGQVRRIIRRADVTQVGVGL
ncbi:hypothetical protein [Mycobacteroides abscessus]|uniref:hypothetical protein n=1 Tax=Mycobacteroides abscessus TaxID=36809 RepID=UPI0002FDBB5E|nr:hypothetical protein [Mycobacteroides abscessus]